MDGIYPSARLYDVAFGFRDVPAEVDFLLGYAARFARPQRQAESFAELACGPGRHAREAARRGLRASGLDRAAEMLAYARAAPDGERVSWVEGDIAGFALPSPVDLVATLMDSLSHVLTLDDLLAHFRAVASALTPGGLYVIEQSHPRDGFPHLTTKTRTSWTMEDGGLTVATDWGQPDDPFDPVTLCRTVQVQMTWSEGGRSGTVSETMKLKIWLATEMDAAIRASGAFEPVERFGAMSAEVAFTDADPRAWRMVSVLRRR